VGITRVERRRTRCRAASYPRHEAPLATASWKRRFWSRWLPTSRLVRRRFSSLPS